jgi:hypothetical protein
MNINKPITNPNLINAMKKLKQGQGSEELFWKEIFNAKFLCPIKMEDGNIPQKGTQKIVLENETHISVLHLDNNEGEHFLMAFTDWKELRKWKQTSGQQTLILSYEEYQKICLEDNLLYQGMVINPFGENIVLNRQILAGTRRNEQVIKKGETVMIGIPREYPNEMVDKLKMYFATAQIVDRAYLMWMERKEDASYLLILDSQISPERLFPTIGQVCQPFLNGKLLDMVLADSKFGKNAIEGQTPFFVR